MSIPFANDLHRAPRTGFLRMRVGIGCVLLACSGTAAWAQAAGPQAATTEAAVVSKATPDGSLSGVVKDATGATIAGAIVTLRAGQPVRSRSVATDAEGAFAFTGVPAGAYQLTVAEAGFVTWAGGGQLQPGEAQEAPEVALAMANAAAEVQVSASRTEVAEAQMQMAEKQRVLGVFPNFYASYVWDAAPLSARQKYRLAWRFAVDPVAVAMAAGIAGTEQSQNGFSGYGQGVQGYAKRFGATYADGFTSTLLGQAVLPAMLHQDPRYFVKGTGTVRQRTEYALAMTVMCRGDNGHWQVNASNMLGNVASASLSNVYYPATNRHGALLTVQNSLISTAAGAVGNLIQEFMLRRMTPDVPDYGAAAAGR